MYTIRSEESGEAKRLTEGKLNEYPPSFSPDGKRLAMGKLGNGGSQDIFTMPVEADPGPGGEGLRLGNAELFLGTPFNEAHPAFSPGGRWQVSSGGGRNPVWSRDGRELLFLSPDRRVKAIVYTAKGDSFAAGNPRVWTEARLQGAFGSFNFNLAPDGKRLAAMVADDASAGKLPTHLTFLLNFFDGLRRKAPAGR